MHPNLKFWPFFLPLSCQGDIDLYFAPFYILEYMLLGKEGFKILHTRTAYRVTNMETIGKNMMKQK